MIKFHQMGGKSKNKKDTKKNEIITIDKDLVKKKQYELKKNQSERVTYVTNYYMVKISNHIKDYIGDNILTSVIEWKKYFKYKSKYGDIKVYNTFDMDLPLIVDEIKKRVNTEVLKTNIISMDDVRLLYKGINEKCRKYTKKKKKQCHKCKKKSIYLECKIVFKVNHPNLSYSSNSQSDYSSSSSS